MKKGEAKGKSIGRKIGKIVAAPFVIIGGVIALLVSYGENEYDPYE